MFDDATDDEVSPALRAVDEALAALSRRLDGAAAWPASARHGVLAAVDRWTSGLTGVRSRVLVAEREAGTWAGRGDRSFQAWVGRTTRAGERAAARQVAQAETLTAMPAVASALASGDLGGEHLDVLARVASRASDEVAARLRSDEGQAQLVAMSRGTDADAYRKALAQWVASVDPERVERDHQEQRARRYLFVTATPGGTEVKGLLDNVAGRRVRSALDAVMPAPSQDDPRTREQRCADGLVTLADTVLGLPEKTTGAVTRPHVSVQITEETWAALSSARAGTGSGESSELLHVAAPSGPPFAGSSSGSLLSGSLLSAESRCPAEPSGAPVDEARGLLGRTLAALRGTPAPTDEDGAPMPASELLRILCDCELTRIVVNAQSEPVDLGRSARLYSGQQRRAVMMRDGGCAWPGCRAKARYCEVHHIRWWERDGGDTSIVNAVLLCTYHHHRVHEYDLSVERLGPGIPTPGARRVMRYRFLRRDGTVFAGDGAVGDGEDASSTPQVTAPSPLVSLSSSIASSSPRAASSPLGASLSPRAASPSPLGATEASFPAALAAAAPSAPPSRRATGRPPGRARPRDRRFEPATLIESLGEPPF